MAEITDFSMSMFSLKGKNAIVTGGNTGLGQAFALALAKGGANLLVPTIMDDGGETRQLIEAEGVRYEEISIDITAEGAPARIIDRCVELFGSIDILVNSAGICINIPDVTQFGRDAWDKMIKINLTAAFEMSHEAAKRMIPQKSGKIINICSLYSFLGGQWSPAYASSKHGLTGFTKAYCDELAQFNIQVNAIAPGYFATKLTEKTRSVPEINQRILAHIPAGRWGDLMDLMGTTVFLASRAADYINGQMVVVDGGYLVR
jgi:NAD(P)-dependent dehydrogenase (short-subunit alcohol dehydrogenase family)